MNKVLYSFATSENPDAYINALAYANEHHNIEKYYIVVISEHDYKNETKSKLLATTISAKISSQLQALSEGKYIEPSGDQSFGDLINKDGIGVYKKCLTTINTGGTSSIVIPINDLDEKIREFVKNENCLFDLSALKNNLLVDVISILLSINFSEVYSFELIKQQTYSQNDLYHNLKNDDYKFRKLTDSKPVKESMLRIGKWMIRAKSIFIFTALIAIVFILLTIYMKDSIWITGLNTAALIASISSYLFLLVNDK